MAHRAVSALFCVAVTLPTAATAYPDGAPWGAANPEAQENCASCHFGNDAVFNSEKIRIDNLPVQIKAGENYEFVVSLTDPKMNVGGFQIVVNADTGANGEFHSAADDVEYAGGAIRSTKPRSSKAGVISWTMTWIAPATVAGPITFYAAAAAANDDGSPFEDTIHYRKYIIAGD